MTLNRWTQILILVLPVTTVFTTSYFYPVHTQDKRPVFQPPDWVFPIAWTYITVAFGYFTNQLLLTSSHHTFTLSLYALLLGGLNVWLFVYYRRLYKTAFYLLIGLTYLSIVYTLSLVHNRISNMWFFLPMPFWLVLASCLNGVIYDAHSPKVVA